MKVEVPLGDVVDKVTILEIKRAEIGSPHVEREWATLREAWSAAGMPPMESLPQYTRLAQVNRALWDVEDALRLCEAAGNFDERFIALARSVYKLNDERASLKRSINRALHSELVEEKSYSGHATPTVDER